MPKTKLHEQASAAVADALGDAYDCTRVWSAWGVGTMGPDDFHLVAADDSRLAEITEAALAPAVAIIDRLREAMMLASLSRGWERVDMRTRKMFSDVLAYHQTTDTLASMGGVFTAGLREIEHDGTTMLLHFESVEAAAAAPDAIRSLLAERNELREALGKASAAMWNSEDNMDNQAAEADAILNRHAEAVGAGAGAMALAAPAAGQPQPGDLCLRHYPASPAPAVALPPAFSVRARGVGVCDDNPSALVVYFNAVPSSQDIRALHEIVTAAPVAQEPVAWLVSLPTEEAERVYHDQDNIGYVDDVTNNPDAVVTPLYAAPVAAQAQPWHDMKTAPQDGTAVLVLIPGSDIPHAVRWKNARWEMTWDGHPLSVHDQPRYWIPCPADPDAPGAADHFRGVTKMVQPQPNHSEGSLEMVPAPAVVGAFRVLLAAGNRLDAESEECEGPDGAAVMIGLDYWNEFSDALDRATLVLSPAPHETRDSQGETA